MALRARDVMTTQLISVVPDARFLQIQHLFVEAQIHAAPIVDPDGKVLGVVTSSDLLYALDQACDEDIDPGEPIDELGDLEERLDELRALDIGTPEPVWVAPDAPLSQVAHRMREEGIHCVLVGNNGELAGMLTTFDLLQGVQ